MELLNRNKEWFLSEEGEKQFFALSSVEERVFFLYSYLKQVLNPVLNKNHAIFKLAFFLADAVFSSDKEYAFYPKLLTVSENPFLAFFASLDFCPVDEVLYVVQMALLHEKVDFQNKNEWIYDKSRLSAKDFLDAFVGTDLHYLPSHSTEMVDLSKYSKEKNDEPLQCMLAWLYIL